MLLDSRLGFGILADRNASGITIEDGLYHHEGLHEFRVMPFGLTNATAAFQQLMQQVLKGLNPQDCDPFVSVFIDNIVVFSKTLDKYLEHIFLVLNRLSDVNLELKPSKCHFLVKEVALFGLFFYNS